MTESLVAVLELQCLFHFLTVSPVSLHGQVSIVHFRGRVFYSHSLQILLSFYSPSILLLFFFYSPFILLLFSFYSPSILLLFSFCCPSICILFSCYSHSIKIFAHGLKLWQVHEVTFSPHLTAQRHRRCEVEALNPMGLVRPGKEYRVFPILQPMLQVRLQSFHFTTRGTNIATETSVDDRVQSP